MPRLETFSLTIKTGAQGLGKPPKYAINGFPLEFEEAKGGTGPGETIELTGSPQSFPHSLTLAGPEEGEWEIAEIQARYECAGSEPYTVRLGHVVLDDSADLNIWHQRPERVFDV